MPTTQLIVVTKALMLTIALVLVRGAVDACEAPAPVASPPPPPLPPSWGCFAKLAYTLKSELF